MKRTEAIYLATEGRADAQTLATATELARALRQCCTLKRAVDAPWIQLERSASAPAPQDPQSPAWFAALLGADARRWKELGELARSLSEAWTGHVITLEGAPQIFWVRYSRWTGGARQRCFEYAANDVNNAGWILNEGPAEPWEDDEEVGPDVASLARALGLPPLDPAAPPGLAWSAAEIVD